MKVETYEQRILIAEEGKFLCNKKDKAIVTKAYLGKDADASDWVEITEDEKVVLEKEWEEEMEVM